MDRVEIKSLAKEKIKGNLWTIWKPYLIIIVIMYIAELIASALINSIPALGSLLGCVIMLGASIVVAGYNAFLLKFVRGEEANINTIIDCVKEKWLQLFITSLLVGIFICLWSMLFVIPGIVKALAYSMALFIVIDTDLSGNDAIRESMKMMDGYKADYFVFQLSFIGWCLLAPFTLGLLYIWLLPYMMVAETIYYDRLREKKGVTVSAKVETETHVTEEPKTEEVIKEPEVKTPSLEDTVVGGEDNDPISNK